MEPVTAARRGISVIIPVFNESASLPELLGELTAVMAGQLHEIIVVDDGSTDGTADAALRHGGKVLRAPSNRGKAAALQAGFQLARGTVIVTMDGDLQDDPAEIPRLIDMLTQFDMVSGWKQNRKDSWSRRTQSRWFRWLVRALTGTDLHDINCGLKAYRWEVAESLHLYGGLHRLIPVLARFNGFSVGEIVVNHRPRKYGRSRYGPIRAFRGPIDLIAVTFLTRFGDMPLQVFGGAGFLLGLIGAVIAGRLSFLRLVRDEMIGNRPALVLAVLLMLVGVQLFSLGVLAEFQRSRAGPGTSPFRLISEPIREVQPGDDATAAY